MVCIQHKKPTAGRIRRPSASAGGQQANTAAVHRIQKLIHRTSGERRRWRRPAHSRRIRISTPSPLDCILGTMSQTSTQCPTPSVHIDFLTNVYQYRVHQLRESEITNGLVAGLYGVLVVLSVQSVCALTQRKTQTSTILLSLTILVLLASTTVYMVVLFIYSEAFSLDELRSAAVDLWSYKPPPDFNSQKEVWDLQRNYTPLLQSTGTTAIMINIILGDAIVWWRACVVWHGNRIVRAVCGVFLMATFVLGVLDATVGSAIDIEHEGTVVVLSSQPGALFEDNSFGLATCLLSLATNLVATLLIAYKAWKCRSRLKGYLLAKAGGPSQVEKLFAILMESGAIYCAIWVIVVAYQISNYNYNRTLGPTPNAEVAFLDAFGIVMNGALVPIIAIYPAIVIVLVASSNASHMEQGLSGGSVCDWTSSRPVLVVDGTVTIGHVESRSRRRSDALPVQGFHGSDESRSEHGLEDSDARANANDWGWKLDRGRCISNV